MPETRNNREEVFKKKNAQIDQKMENDDFRTPKAAGGSRNNGSATKFLSEILTEIKSLRPYLAGCWLSNKNYMISNVHFGNFQKDGEDHSQYNNAERYG